MIHWLQQKEFWSAIDRATPPVMIDFRGWCFFHISYSVLRRNIGAAEPNQDLTGEDDTPGAVSRWYAYLDSIPLLLDYHHAHPHGEVVVLQHADKPGAREAVRQEFASWGDHWLESNEAES